LVPETGAAKAAPPAPITSAMLSRSASDLTGRDARWSFELFCANAIIVVRISPSSFFNRFSGLNSPPLAA